MDYTEINRCLEILNKKTSFFGKENIAEKLQIFHTVQRLGTPGTIHSLIALLSSDNVLIKAKAAETILCLFLKIKSLNEYADVLKYLSIEESDLDFYRIDFDETTYVQLLGIASFNRSGYVRQKAVEELARVKNAASIKFLLFRLGDWVPAVRKSAMQAVQEFLEYNYINELLKQLPIIDWLLKVERVDLREIHNRLIKFIVNQDFSEDFYKRLKQADDKVRLRFYKLILTNKPATKEQINRISADKYFLVRAELLTHPGRFDLITQRELIAKLLQDKSASIRLKALYSSKSFSPVFDRHIVLLSFDEAASIRELSRYLLRDKGIDFAAQYRLRIAEGNFTPGSLAGLSETGNQEDLGTFESHIHSKKNKLVIASLNAINKFDPGAAKQHALKLMVHSSKRVRDKAVDILVKNDDSQTLESIRNLYVDGTYEVKRSILLLYGRVGGWSVIGDLLLAISDEHPAIQELAWELLDKWRSKATRLFTTPPKAAIDRANKIYSGIDGTRLNMTTSRSNLLQELRFCLG